MRDSAVNIIFLDIDGVLNTREWDTEVRCGSIHKDKVELFNAILRRTDAKIVLSSAWRYLIYRGEMNLIGMEWLLRSHGILADRLIGITRKDTEVEQPKDWTGDLRTWLKSNERGEQIQDWINEFDRDKITRYVVIDDLDLGIRSAGHPFVQTEDAVGLRHEDATKAIRILLGM